MESYFEFISELIRHRLLSHLNQDIIAHLRYLNSENVVFLLKIQVLLRIKLVFLELNFALRVFDLESDVVHIIKRDFLLFIFEFPVVGYFMHLFILFIRQLHLLQGPEIVLFHFESP